MLQSRGRGKSVSIVGGPGTLWVHVEKMELKHKLRSHTAIGSRDGDLNVKGKSSHKQMKLGDDNTDNKRDLKIRKQVAKHVKTTGHKGTGW